MPDLIRIPFFYLLFFFADPCESPPPCSSFFSFSFFFFPQTSSNACRIRSSGENDRNVNFVHQHFYVILNTYRAICSSKIVLYKKTFSALWRAKAYSSWANTLPFLPMIRSLRISNMENTQNKIHGERIRREFPSGIHSKMMITIIIIIIISFWKSLGIPFTFNPVFFRFQQSKRRIRSRT